MKKTYSIILCLSLFCVFESCNQKNKVEFLGYNQDILKNWGTNIIFPTYKAYQSQMVILVNEAQKFQKNKTEEQLQKLRDSWLNAYRAFQRTLIFGSFKSAENTYLIEMANTYPANKELIDKNVKLVKENKINEILLEPTYADVQRVYQGFPALDYLLFEKTHTLDYYNGEEGDSACTYIVLLTKFLQKNIDYVVNSWEEYGLADYIVDKDVSSNGAYAATINSFIKAYEKNIRAEKVGYAAGAINVQQGKPSPKFIEAYYNGKVSKELLKIAVQSSQDFFNGKHFGKEQTGKSLRSALEDLEQKQLVQRVNEQYAKIYEIIEKMPNSLKETAVSDNPKMRELYLALQRNVAYYKISMLAALNVQVGYQDTDGD